MKTILTFLSLALSTTTFAKGHQGTCIGKKGPHIILLRGEVADIKRIEQGHGTVSINGNELTSFSGDDLTYSLLKRSFKLLNSRGDLIEGEAISLKEKKVLIKNLKIPGYRITLSNINVQCEKN